jgi:hypothetical protein
MALYRTMICRQHMSFVVVKRQRRCNVGASGREAEYKFQYKLKYTLQEVLVSRDTR